MPDTALHFLETLHPYDALPGAARADLAADAEVMGFSAGDEIYALGDASRGIYVIISGSVAVHDASGTAVSLLQAGNTFGERGLMRDGYAVTSASAETDTQLLHVPAEWFRKLRDENAAFARFFDRSGKPVTAARKFDLTHVRVADLMVKDPVACAPDTPIRAAAETMTSRRISCICITDAGTLTGIVTLRDMVGQAIAKGVSLDAPVSQIMTANPISLPPSAIGSDVLHMMMEYRLGHVPITQSGALVGIVTQTDLTRYQASSAAGLVSELAKASSAKDMAEITARIPQLLVQLVAAGHRHDVVTRHITDVADVVTRRLLAQAEAELGAPPVPYLWLACGSQGRHEQTGVSDQDNCLILHDDVDDAGMAYFEKLANIVCDGLNTCGYVYCPGDMMASNPRWRQPLNIWREYFSGWIKSPSKEAQMLASVMFDLRPIGGDVSLFHGLKGETLRHASANSIFTAHMASNALTHQTPLGLLKGIATIRSGEHRDTVDMKHTGVVPVVDLGRMYALQGQLDAVNTRARLDAAIAAGTVSESGGRDLLDAYDLVADARLDHQAAQIKRGEAPDNFLPPADLSSFERSHLRDAFVVIKTMQSALMQGRGALG